MKTSDLSIRKRFVLLVSIAVLPVLALAVILSIFFASSEKMAVVTNVVTRGVSEAATELERFWVQAQSDTQFIRQSHYIQGILRAREAGGVDPISRKPEKVLKEQLALIFGELAESKGVYDQVRFIDSEGMEIVRVNLLEGRSAIVPEEALQNKKHRYYFSETARLGDGELYTSSIDLNRERGVVEEPYKPMVRMAAPVYDQNDRFSGIVIINVLMKQPLNFMKDVLQGTGFWFVTDESGDYLHNGLSPEKEWGGQLDLSTGEGLKKDFPDNFKDILAGGSLEAIIEGENMLLFTKAFKPWTDEAQFLLVGHAVPVSVVKGPAYRIGFLLVTAAVLSVLVSILAVLIGVRKIMEPIVRVSSVVKRFREGHLEARAEYSFRDEIGELVGSFNEMAGEIARHRDHLEEEVAERTKELKASQGAALSLMQDANKERERAEAALTLLSQSEEALSKRAYWLSGLQKAGERVAACRTVEETASIAVMSPVEYLGMVTVFVSVPSSENVVQILESSNPGLNHKLANDGCAREVLRTGTSRIMLDVKNNPPFPDCADDASTENFNGCASFPIFAGDECVAALTVRSPADEYDGLLMGVVPLLEVFCRQVGYVWQRCIADEELRQARDAAEEASGAKSDFLAGMSHELRTPLNAIIGFSQMLQERYYGDLNKKQMEYVIDIVTSGQHLLALINEILDLSRIEAGKMELELSDVNVKSLLEGSLVMIKEVVLKHGITLVLNVHDGVGEMGITADERKLKQVLFNLLSNAAKFTTEGGGIELKARSEDSEMIISVADTGVGLEAGDLQKVFDEFYQVSGSTQDNTPGTGLGLPLSKGFVELHGGRIWAESEGEGKGSTFTFTIPVKMKVSPESTLRQAQGREVQGAEGKTRDS